MLRTSSLGVSTLLVALLVGCGTAGEPRSLEVSASAYNSVASQTNEQPDVAAWGDVLKPGMRAIAVSPDLIELGLGHGTEVTIEGLRGRYRVLDKTAARFTKRIDIYMGIDVDAAKEWGVKTVTITWRIQE